MKLRRAVTVLLAAGILIGVCILIGYRAYSNPELYRCYWRYEDSDFCYTMTALRWLEGLPNFYLDHPGYTLHQFLGWAYAAGSLSGFLPHASYGGFAGESDPLRALQVYVAYGWLSSWLAYAATTLVLFAFAASLTASLPLATLAGLLYALSSHSAEFIIRIRPEQLSVLFALAGLLTMLTASRATRLRSFSIYVVAGSCLLSYSLLSKIQSFPVAVLALFPLAMNRSISFDPPNAASHRYLLGLVALANALMAPLTLLMLKPFVYDLLASRGFWLLLLALLGLLLALSVMQVRPKWRGQPTSTSRANRTVALWVLLIGLLVLGIQVATRVAFIHPRLNVMVTGPVLANDIGKSLFLVVHPETNRQFVRAVTPGLLGDVFLGALPHYATRRLDVLAVIAISLGLYYRDIRRVLPLAGYLLLVGFLLLSASRLRYAQTPTYYITYEESFTLLAAVVCLSWSRDSLKTLARLRLPGRDGRIRLAVLALCMAILVVPRALAVREFGRGFACPSITQVAATGSCICNAIYAERTGLRPLIEEHYGKPCEEAVRDWSEHDSP